MAQFSYRAAARGGSVKSGTIEADSAADAIARLQRQGLMPIAATPARPPGSTQRGARKPLRAAPLAKLTSELGVLVRSGLPLDRALTIAIDNIELAPLRQQWVEVHRRVKEGTPLSAAVAADGAVFPAIMAPMIEAGEADGRLGDALGKLGSTLERAAKLRQTIVSAMIYPAVLTGMAVLVILMMLTFVVPQFEGLFGNNIDQLPPTTLMILHVSRAVREQGLLMLAVSVGGVFAIRAWIKRPGVRVTIDRMLLSLPQLGDLIRRIESARFARVLGGLIGSGVPLPPALALAQRTIVNQAMARTTGTIVARVKEGAALSAQCAATGIFPRMVVSFIRTGEETGRLPELLERLADVLDDEVAVRLGRMVGLITPAITIAMGFIIALLIGSIMTAILGFNSLALG